MAKAETRFTPGPWDNRPGRHLFGAEIFSQNLFVAAVMRWEGLNAVRQAEAKANAALIAAAPDLYAAAKEVEDVLRNLGTDCDPAYCAGLLRAALSRVEQPQ